MRAEELIAEAASGLSAIGIHNGVQEARWLFAHVRGLMSGPPPYAVGTELGPRLEREFRALLGRRLGGEPLQYVMGSAEFYGIELEVGPGVLIPRPETERLVDFAIEVDTGEGPVCDVCTGSGAVALALAANLPGAREVWGVDISETALGYARRNAGKHGLDICFLRGDLFDPLPPAVRFALITANPPYVSPDAYRRLPRGVREYEPESALLAREQGLALVARLARESRARLRADGTVVCEISSEQGRQARCLFEDAGFGPVCVRQDYTERDRVVVATWPGAIRNPWGDEEQ